jgi:hypothetical protein
MKKKKHLRAMQSTLVTPWAGDVINKATVGYGIKHAVAYVVDNRPTL